MPTIKLVTEDKLGEHTSAKINTEDGEHGLRVKDEILQWKDDDNNWNDASAKTMTGATSTTDGKSGLVPKPLIADKDKALKGDGTFGDYGDNIVYNEETSKLQLKNGSKVLSEVEIQGGGGGSVELPDVTNATISAESKKVLLSWSDPDNVVISGVTLAKWDGTLIVRKQGSMPSSRTDGTVVLDSKIKNQYSTDKYEDTTVENDKTYYYRFFPYTDGKKYTNGTILSATPKGIKINVTTAEVDFYGKDVVLSLGGSTVDTKAFSDSGSVSFTADNLGEYTVTCETYSASATASAYGDVLSINLAKGIQLGTLSVGDEIVDYGTRYNDAPIVWVVADHNHDGDGTTTLISKNIIALKAFDAKEPTNSDSKRITKGNNRYIFSNILQWLNSNAKTNWYSAQHTYDAPPTSANVTYNSYDAEKGLLANISSAIKDKIKETSKVTVKPTVDGGSSEDVTSKMFLLSTTEVGLADENGIAEGVCYSLFTDATSRLAYPTSESVSKSDYTSTSLESSKPWLWILRTPYYSDSYDERLVTPGGGLGLNDSNVGYFGIRPAFASLSNLMLEKDKNLSNQYVVKNDVIPLSAPTATIKAGNTTATIKWNDPDDITADGVAISTWGGTALVRKSGSAPTSIDDGAIVVNSTTRNQYATTGFEDTGLTNGTTYYYGVFPYNTKSVYTYDTVVSCTPKAIDIVTWADGTDAQIKAMLDAHYNGDIEIADYWSVGDTRTVSLSAMAATGVGESHAAQNVEFVIIGIEHDDLASAINGKTKAAITVHMKNCLNEAGYMNSSYGSYTDGKYSTSQRRTWINNVFEKALPAWWRNNIKIVSKQTCEAISSGNSSLVSSTEKCFMLSIWEIFGTGYGTYFPSADGVQYDYYKTQSNKIKQIEGTSYMWWARSGYFDSVYSFGRYGGCNLDGGRTDSSANDDYGLAIALCL